MGQWWVPSQPETKQPGFLTLPDQGAWRLRLLTSLLPERPVVLPGGQQRQVYTRRMPVLHGLVGWNGRPMTLLGCVSDLEPFPGKDQTILVNSVVSGAHVDEQGGALVRSMTFRYENLTRFVQRFAEDAPSTCEFEVNGLQFSLEVRDNTSHSLGTNAGNIPFRAEASITVTSPEPSPRAELDKFAKCFQDFVTVVADKACALLEQSGHTDDGTPFEVRERLTVTPEPAGLAQEDRRFVFFGAQTDLAAVLRNWVELWTASRPALDLLVAARYAPDSYLETKVLTMAISLERLHPAIFPNARTEFLEVNGRRLKGIRQACEDLPPEDQDWLSNLLPKDISFSNRLRQLATLVDGDALSELIPRFGPWSRELVSMRGQLAHSGSGEAPSMRKMEAQARYFCDLVIMACLGLKASHQIDLAKKVSWVHGLDE